MKLSRYNYYTRNKQDELLLFNTLVGTSSFIKIPKVYADDVEGVLAGKREINSLEDSIYNELKKQNYIVFNDIDEDAQLRRTYLDQIADSQLQLTIIPTEQCNFRCKYCYESFPDKVMSMEVQNSILLYLKKNLHRYSSLHVSWFGGEPLLTMDTIEYLSENIKKICAFYKKPFTASITTNGFLLNIDNFKRLLKYNVIYYQITIDGTKDIHDIQRPHEKLNVSTYETVIGNLCNIKTLVKSSVFRITIRSNFSKLYFNRINEYKNIFYTLFGDDKRFQFFVRPVMDWGGERIETFKDNLIDNNFMNELYDNLTGIDCKLNFIYNDFLNNGGGVCEAGKKNTFVIITNGDIYKCTCNFQEEQEAKIGKLLANGEMDINKNLEDTWICNMDNCEKECFYSPICLKEACPAVRVLQKKGKQNCPLEKRNLSKILQLLDEENDIFRRVDK